MPIFNNIFTPKKSLARKKKSKSSLDNNSELVEDFGIIKLNLGETSAVFEEGVWIPDFINEDGRHTYNEIISLKESFQTMEEENYLLKIKVELLINMATKLEIKNRKSMKEIDHLKKLLKKYRKSET